MKSFVPAAICFLGMLICMAFLRPRPPQPTGKVEIIVHGPDGTIIPPVRRAPK